MKTIIFSDIHHRIDWIEAFICDQEFDELIFIGDYLDNWGDSVKDAKNTAKWLKHSLTCPNRIHLMGNHDAPVAFPSIRAYRCSGWTQEKSDAVNSIMTRDDWNKLKLCHFSQGWLMSHAGAHPHIFSHPIKGCTIPDIEEQCQKALESSRMGSPSHYMMAGRSRGGAMLVGGVIWCDWNDDFQPIEGISQIVGHTILKEPTEYSIVGSSNWGIDCNNRYITIIEDGVVRHITNDYL